MIEGARLIVPRERIVTTGGKIPPRLRMQSGIDIRLQSEIWAQGLTDLAPQGIIDSHNILTNEDPAKEGY
jgi:hypothetical protein